MSTNVGPTLMQHITSGKLRPLAVGAPHRLDALPNVPTFTELGYAKANMASTFGVFAPAKTPAPVVARLNAEINKALAAPDLRDRLTQAAVVPVGGTPSNSPPPSARNTTATAASCAPPASRNSDPAQAVKRYPTPTSVSRCSGRAGSRSSLWRRWPM